MKFQCKTIPSGIKNKIADRFVMRTLVNVRYPDKEKLANKLGISVHRLSKILDGNRGTTSEFLDMTIVMDVPYELFRFFWGPNAREVKSA